MSFEEPRPLATNTVEPSRGAPASLRQGSGGPPKLQRRRKRGTPEGGLQVAVGDARGRPLRIAGLASWLRRVAPAAARGRVSLVLVSDQRIRALNCRYRGKDYATDVLSFPSATKALPRRTRNKPYSVASARLRRTRRRGFSVTSVLDGFLGEIVIARGVARRQAREAHHSELTELRVLALHGLLHLLGYDHERDSGRMRRAEQRLRRKGGLREGLIERTGFSAPV
jgi:probable rRNA maturation factor